MWHTKPKRAFLIGVSRSGISIRAMVAMMAIVGAAECTAAMHADCAGPDLRIRTVDGQLVVSCVYLNGHGPFLFVIDTGAEVNLVDPEVARSVKLKSTYTTDVVTPVGRKSATGTSGVSVSLGPLTATHQSFLFDRMISVHAGFGTAVQGVLGQTFLSNFDYWFNLRKSRLIFGKANPPGIRVPLLDIVGLPAVSTSMGPLILDSGASYLTLYKTNTFADETLTLDTHSGAIEASLQMAGPLMISSQRVRYGKALVLPLRLQPPAVPGLLPVSLFNSAYICNSGGYAVLD
jgi:Aspartyl protease